MSEHALGRLAIPVNARVLLTFRRALRKSDLPGTDDLNRLLGDATEESYEGILSIDVADARLLRAVLESSIRQRPTEPSLERPYYEAAHRLVIAAFERAAREVD